MLRFTHWKKRLFPLNPSFNTLMFLLYFPPQEVFKMITTRQHRRLNTMTTMTTMPPLTTTTVTAQEPHSIATVNNRSSTLQYWQPYLCFLCVFLVTMAHNATNSAEDNEVSATMIIPNEVPENKVYNPRNTVRNYIFICSFLGVHMFWERTES